jgi:acyl-CoA synthetase (NDP forming)
MFDPKTIALIGATEKQGAIGRTILKNSSPIIKLATKPLKR